MAEVRSSEIRRFEAYASQIRFCEVSSHKIGSREVSMTEICMVEARSSQIGFREVGIGEVSSSEIRSCKVSAAEIWLYRGMLPPPGIPYSYALIEPIKMLPMSHNSVPFSKQMYP